MSRETPWSAEVPVARRGPCAPVVGDRDRARPVARRIRRLLDRGDHRAADRTRRRSPTSRRPSTRRRAPASGSTSPTSSSAISSSCSRWRSWCSCSGAQAQSGFRRIGLDLTPAAARPGRRDCCCSSPSASPGSCSTRSDGGRHHRDGSGRRRSTRTGGPSRSSCSRRCGRRSRRRSSWSATSSPGCVSSAGRKWTIILAAAALRGSYHLYQGFGPFIGNFVMGVVFGWCYTRWGRVMPLVIAHCRHRHRLVRRLPAGRRAGGRGIFA